MPSFAYINQTNFRPFSYQEMLAPVLMATQAHQAVEEAYSELDSQANAIGSLANEANDPVTYQRYKAYESALRTQADALAKNGLTPGSRKTLLDLKGRYAKDITPIQNAITRRRELADEQRKALLQNPTLMFQRDMNSMSYESSLDRFLENPDYDYGERYSGALLTQQVSQAASNLAKELSNYGNGKRLDAFTKTFIQQHGFTRDQVLDAINNPNRAQSQPVLNAIVEQVIGASGMAGWADGTTMKKAYKYARLGLWSAIGQTNISPYEDYGAKLAAQEAMQIRAEKRAAARQAQQQGRGFELNPSNIYSSRELSEEEKRYQYALKHYSQYFYKDANGRTKMTWKGRQEYNRNATPIVTSAGSGSGTARLMNVETQMQGMQGGRRKFTPTAFRQFMDSIGAYSVTKGKWQPGNLGNVWNRYVNNSPAARTARYDATRATEYIYDVEQSPEYQRNYKAKLSRAIDDTEKLVEVDYDPKSNKWKATGKTLSFADFDTDDYTLVSRAPSELGTTLFIKKKGEKARRYMAPSGVNITAEGGRDQTISEMLMTRRMLQNPKLTPQQRGKLEKHYDNLTQQQMMFESGLDLTNKTKTQEFNSYYIP